MGKVLRLSVSLCNYYNKLSVTNNETLYRNTAELICVQGAWRRVAVFVDDKKLSVKRLYASPLLFYVV